MGSEEQGAGAPHVVDFAAAAADRPSGAAADLVDDLVEQRQGKLVPKHVRRLDGSYDIVISLVSRGSKYWLGVLTEIKNRGVTDILIACCDGLTGFSDAIETVWPQTIVQTCHYRFSDLARRRPRTRT